MFVADLFKSRSRLEAENLFLRHQLNIDEIDTTILQCGQEAIERPSPPKRKERHLTREQCRALIEAAAMPHLKLYVILALATGGRNAALLDLTWERCDFDRGLIDLRDPNIGRPHKGRAIVPMNRSIRAALLEARGGALSDHVIEWAGRRVASVKRGLKFAARLRASGGRYRRTYCGIRLPCIWPKRKYQWRRLRNI
jgi:integrase